MIVEVSVGDTDPGEYFMKGPTDLVSLWTFTSHPFTGHSHVNNSVALKIPFNSTW